VQLERQTTQRRNRAGILADVKAALLRLLDHKPFNDVTVDELAREAGLSRTAFYFYYRDKNEVLTACLGDIAEAAHDRAGEWWSGHGPPEVMVEQMVQTVGALWKEHTSLLRAAVEVSAYDPAFAAVYRGLMNAFIKATQDHLRREQAAGKLRAGIDADGRAEAMIWMGERFHYIGMVSGRSAEETAEVLTGIWVHALYPDEITAG
jgi:AcrR family transcriptional regulator